MQNYCPISNGIDSRLIMYDNEMDEAKTEILFKPETCIRLRICTFEEIEVNSSFFV